MLGKSLQALCKIVFKRGAFQCLEFILLKDFNKMEFRLYKKDDADDEEEEEEQEEK